VNVAESADTGSGAVEVVTTDGESFMADVVLVTLPLAILRQNSVVFKPPLPPAKLQAVQNLGVGVMEKVSCHSLITAALPLWI